MTTPLPDFKRLQPQTVAEAVTALRSNADARLCAGGTDLIVNMRHGLVDTGTLVDLGGIADLKTIRKDGTGLRIGAGVSLRTLRDDPRLVPYGAVPMAAAAIAGRTHQNVATLGGNLCLDTRCIYYNQSQWWRQSNDFCLKYQGTICHVAPKGDRCRAAYSGDLAPALMVNDAKVEITGPAGTRHLNLGDFFHEDGAAFLALERDEILVAIHLPAPWVSSVYGKIRVRSAIEFPLAGVAVAARKSVGGHDFSFALTGTNSAPILSEMPGPLAPDDDQTAYFEAMEKLVKKTATPQRTTTIQPHYRRLAIASLAKRLAENLVSGAT